MPWNSSCGVCWCLGGRVTSAQRKPRYISASSITPRRLKTSLTALKHKVIKTMSPLVIRSRVWLQSDETEQLSDVTWCTHRKDKVELQQDRRWSRELVYFVLEGVEIRGNRHTCRILFLPSEEASRITWEMYAVGQWQLGGLQGCNW